MASFGQLRGGVDARWSQAMEREQRQRVCGLILGLVVKDGVITDEEALFVRRLVAAFGLSEEDGAHIRPIVDGEEAARELRTLPLDDRHETMSLLIEAAAVDGHVAPVEQAHLDAVGRAVGWSPEEVAARVAAIVAAARLR